MLTLILELQVDTECVLLAIIYIVECLNIVNLPKIFTSYDGSKINVLGYILKIVVNVKLLLKIGFCIIRPGLIIHILNINVVEHQRLIIIKNLVLNTKIKTVYGVASTPGIFQREMEKIFLGMPYALCYLDDILIAENDLHHHKI